MKLDATATLPYLIEACADEYPIVRFFAMQGLAALEPRLGKPDYLAPPAMRQRVRAQLWQKILALRPEITPEVFERATKQAEMLRKHRVNVDLDVGE